MIWRGRYFPVSLPPIKIFTKARIPLILPLMSSNIPTSLTGDFIMVFPFEISDSTSLAHHPSPSKTMVRHLKELAGALAGRECIPIYPNYAYFNVFFSKMRRIAVISYSAPARTERGELLGVVILCRVITSCTCQVLDTNCKFTETMYPKKTSILSILNSDLLNRNQSLHP